MARIVVEIASRRSLPGEEVAAGAARVAIPVRYNFYGICMKTAGTWQYKPAFAQFWGNIRYKD